MTGVGSVADHVGETTRKQRQEYNGTILREASAQELEQTTQGMHLARRIWRMLKKPNPLRTRWCGRTTPHPVPVFKVDARLMLAQAYVCAGNGSPERPLG
jgi:hypothetical protein